MAKVPQSQVPGVYHRRVGDIVVSAVSDGFLDGSMAVLQNIAPDDAARMLREERGRAMQLAGSLGQEVKAAALETVEAVADTARDKASQAASRVGDRANEEFRNIQSGQGGSTGMTGPGDPVIG